VAGIRATMFQYLIFRNIVMSKIKILNIDRPKTSELKADNNVIRSKLPEVILRNR
jgi:hypothetical protein